MTQSVSLGMQSHFNYAGQSAVETLRATSSSEKAKLAVKVVTLARYIGSSSKKMLANARHMPVVGSLKLFKLPLIPLSLHAIGTSLTSKEKLTRNEKIDVGLDVVSDVGTVGDTVVTVAEGLHLLGAVTEHAIRWATPLVIVSAALEAAGIVQLIKSMLETRRFSQLFHQVTGMKSQAEEYTLGDFTQARLLIQKKSHQEKSFVSKHFRTDGAKLNQRLEAIEEEVHRLLSSSDEQEILQGRRKLQTTMETLKGRIKAKQHSSALSILNGIVSLVAFALLFTPAGMVGYGVLAGSGIVSLGNLFVDRDKTRQFEKDLGLATSKEVKQ